jgi:peptidoglycan hydrolase CwlO-like protein
VPKSTSRVRRGLIAVLALVAAAGVWPDGSSAAPTDARSDRERVRRERADTAAQINVLQASNQQVQDALDALNANVAGEQASLNDAQRALAESNAALAAAQQREADTQAQINQQNERLRQVAIEAYTSAGSLDEATAMLRSDDIEEGVQRRSLVDLRAGQYRDVLAQLRSLSEDLAIARAEAEQAQQAAQAHQAEVADRLASAQAAQAQQAAVAAQVDARLDQALSEAANLASMDSQLSAQIDQEAAALAARNRAASSGGGGVGGGGGPVTVVSHGDLCTVGSITVACSISDALGRMLNAASADGITLGGGGYRDSSSQIALRRAHCGSSDYAVYQMSPSACHPPTARPGQSMHEKGLAIDFTCNGGRAIPSHSSPCFQWLASHAASYGFRNLPSEPWHWSTNGT